MKRTSVYFLFFFVLSNLVYSQDTITVYYDEEWEEITNKDEAVFYRKAFKDSDNAWIVHDYYKSNILQMLGSYKSKKMKEKRGHFIYYYENGHKSSEGKYLSNKPEGVWSYWYENGQKKSEGNYSDGKRGDEWNYWNESGNLENREYFKNGLLYSAEGFFENGTMSYKGKYFLGSQHGMWTYWNTEGRIMLKGKFKYGMKDGEWIKYFRNSNMKINYNNGVESKQFGGIIRRE